MWVVVQLPERPVNMAAAPVATTGAAEGQEVITKPADTSKRTGRADVLARAARHDYGIRVTTTRADGVVVSQVYASLAAAERKVARCRERGLPVSLVLVRLVPVAGDPVSVLGGAA